MKKSKKKRTPVEINAGSMADIAFLLLIFFLVTTTINAEQGIKVTLPPHTDEPVIHEPLNARNILSVKINFKDELLVEGEPAKIKNLKEQTIEFITNEGVNPNLSENPRRAVVSIQNDRGTKYEAYLGAYNEVKAAYNTIWENESQKRFNTSYENASKDQKKEIQIDYPLVISEAEPTRIGE